VRRSLATLSLLQVIVLLCLLAGCATTQPSSVIPLSASLQLLTLADQAWERQVERAIGYRIRNGLPITRLPAESFEAAAEEARFARQLLAELERIDAAALTPDERTTRAVLLWQMEQQIAAAEHYWLRFRVTPYASSFRELHQIFPTRRFDTDDDAARYLTLLEQYAAWIDQLTEVTLEQQRRGILLPHPEIDLVAAMLHGFAQPSAQSLFAVDASRVAALSDSESFRREVDRSIDERIVPAFQRLITLVTGDDYRAAAPTAIGMSQYPGGTEAYEWLVRHHTTLRYSPEELHQRGLDEVARIHRELDEIRKETAWPGTSAEFFTHLATAPRFFAETPDEVRQRLEHEVRRIEPHLDDWFSIAPRAPYQVRRLDPGLEGAMTFGFYQPPGEADPSGYYFFNGSKLDERNLLFATALMLHELVPGHHFQIALQFENRELHPIRRENYQTAFIEGWAEYAATLGTWMGLYDDPWDRAGLLMMDLLLSTRLVVDTGMNHLGWSRGRAIEFMKANTFMSDAEIATETLRYAVDIPGQALAYKSGSLELVEMRERASARLGPHYDVRQFHDFILLGGSMPLSILDERLEEWIEAQIEAHR
jgi:uncharacterized protein (DUF885 family)